MTDISTSLPPICVVMAVFRPDAGYLTAQLASIANQTHMPSDVVIVIADMVSKDLTLSCASAAGLKEESLSIVVPTSELDAPRAFEAGLIRAIDITTQGTFIALSDQDDLWHKDRLEKGAVALVADETLMMVHSDARLVNSEGDLQQPSMFAFEKRHRDPGLRGLLYRNNVTGMTVLMRREPVEIALPFPPQSGVHYYHDLWLALVACAMGQVKLIKAPLVDYRQHSDNAIGAVDRQTRTASGNPFSEMWMRREAGSYGLARYLARSLQARMANAVSGGQLIHGQTFTSPLRPYLRRRGLGLVHLGDALKLLVTGNPGLARIAAGQAMVSLGRIVWSVRKALSGGLFENLSVFDARLYNLSPGVAPAEIDANGNAVTGHVQDAEAYLDVRKRPSFAPRFDATAPAINVLVPTLNPTETFAGIATAIDVGVGLAQRGHRIRFIATDLPMVSPEASRRFVLGRLEAAFQTREICDRIELACGVMGDGKDAKVSVAAHKGDQFFATAWWSAHVAKTLIEAHNYTHKRMAYLIQDFEPYFYPWGTQCADAMASYGFNILPVFNTTVLRDHFADQGFDFATQDALAFRPSIDIARYASGARKPQPRRKLALYGRPEVERNMFPMAIEALSIFLEAEGIGPDDIDLVSVGLSHDPVRFSTGARLESLGKLPWEEYPNYLLGVDVGLSLMYSPHPSHPPLEMGAAGVRVVTNLFGSKDLGALGSGIISCEPTPPALSAALSEAWHAGPVPDEDRRIDLSPLGLTLDAMLDQLSDRMTDSS